MHRRKQDTGDKFIGLARGRVPIDEEFSRRNHTSFAHLTKLDVGMKRYDHLYEDADVVLLEPDRDDYSMFFSNIFSFSERSAMCAHAYQSTRRDLLQRLLRQRRFFRAGAGNQSGPGDV